MLLERVLPWQHQDPLRWQLWQRHFLSLFESLHLCLWDLTPALQDEPSSFSILRLHWNHSFLKIIDNLTFFLCQVLNFFIPLPASSSINPTFSLEFSSLYEFSCRFHSSTFAVDSWRADVRRALLFFKVVNSTSHFLALAELYKKGCIPSF